MLFQFYGLIRYKNVDFSIKFIIFYISRQDDGKQPATAGCTYKNSGIVYPSDTLSLNEKKLLHKRIFRGVGKACGLVIRDIFDPEIGKDLEQLFAEMSECHSTVMRIALL